LLRSIERADNLGGFACLEDEDNQTKTNNGGSNGHANDKARGAGGSNLLVVLIIFGSVLEVGLINNTIALVNGADSAGHNTVAKSTLGVLGLLGEAGEEGGGVGLVIASGGCDVEVEDPDYEEFSKWYLSKE